MAFTRPFLNVVGDIDDENHQDRDSDGPHSHEGLELGGNDRPQGKTDDDQAVIDGSLALALVVVEAVLAPGHDRFLDVAAGEDVAVAKPLNLDKSGILHGQTKR